MPYSPEEKEQFAREWLEGNLSLRELGERIGVSKWTLKSWVARVKKGQPLFSHGGARWEGPLLSCTQRSRIVARRLEGWPVAQIVETFGHDPKTVYRVLREEGLTDPRRTGRPTTRNKGRAPD